MNDWPVIWDLEEEKRIKKTRKAHIKNYVFSIQNQKKVLENLKNFWDSLIIYHRDILKADNFFK